MIEHVQAGQRISASKINSLIDCANEGAYEFDSTFGHSGKAVFQPTRSAGAEENARYELLDVYVGEGLSGAGQTYIQLGRDVAMLKSQLDTKHVWIWDKESSQLKEVTDEMLKPNDDSFYNDGWTATGLSAFSDSFKMVTAYAASGDKGVILADTGWSEEMKQQAESSMGDITSHEERVLAFMTSKDPLKAAVVQCRLQTSKACTCQPAQWQLSCLMDKREAQTTLPDGTISSVTYVTPKVAFWNSDVAGDSSVAAVCWNGKKFTSEFTDLSSGWNVLKEYPEAKEGEVQEFDCQAYLYLHAIGPAKVENALADEYLTEATWNVLDGDSVLDIEERCHIGADGNVDDGREVKALHPIGLVKMRDNTPQVSQCMLGACEFLEMGWGRQGGSGGGAGEQKADSEMLSSEVAVQTKSLDRQFYEYEVSSVNEEGQTVTELCTGSYFLMHNFGYPAEEAIVLSASSSGTQDDDYKTADKWKILVRDGEAEVPELKYASLQVDMPSLSTDSGDMEDQQSIQMVDEDTHGFGTLQLFGFDQEEANSKISLKAETPSGSYEGPQVLVRDGKTLKYAAIDTSELLSGNSDLSSLSNDISALSAQIPDPDDTYAKAHPEYPIHTIEEWNLSGKRVFSLYGIGTDGEGSNFENYMSWNDLCSDTAYTVLPVARLADEGAFLKYIEPKWLKTYPDNLTLEYPGGLIYSDKISLYGATNSKNRLTQGETIAQRDKHKVVLLNDDNRMVYYTNLKNLVLSGDLSSYSLSADHPIAASQSKGKTVKDVVWNLSVHNWDQTTPDAQAFFLSKIYNFGESGQNASLSGDALVREDGQLKYKSCSFHNCTITDAKSVQTRSAGDAYADIYNVLEIKGWQNAAGSYMELKPQSEADWKSWLKGGSTITCDSYIGSQNVGMDYLLPCNDTQNDNEIVYAHPQQLALPALWKADDVSIERKNAGESNAYDQLKGWDEGGSELTVSIVPGGDVSLGTGDFLMRNSGLKYNRIALHCPEMSASQSQMNQITQQIIQQTTNISNIVSADVEDLSGQIGSCWKQGESFGQNYGNSIGNSSQEKVIDLDWRYLPDTWQCDQMQSLTCTTENLKVGNVDVTMMLQFLSQNETALVWLCQNWESIKALVENSSS